MAFDATAPRPFYDPDTALDAEFAKIEAVFSGRGWSFAKRPVESLDGLADSIALANSYRLRGED